MSIDISKLSAKELFELARQKEQEEQKQAEFNEHLNKLKQQRDEMLGKFKRALAKLDGEIKQLQTQRDQLMSDHDQDLSRLNGEIEETEERVGDLDALELTEPPKPSEKPAAKSTEASKTKTEREDEKEQTKPPPRKEADSEELLEEIKTLMRSREYISESLLKERLRGMGYSSLNLTKGLEKLTKEKYLIRKSGGSYILGKK